MRTQSTAAVNRPLRRFYFAKKVPAPRLGSVSPNEIIADSNGILDTAAAQQSQPPIGLCRDFQVRLTHCLAMRQLNKAALAFEQTKRHCYLGAPMLAMTLSDTYYRDRNVADNPIVRGLVTKKYWPRAPRVPAGYRP